MSSANKPDKKPSEVFRKGVWSCSRCNAIVHVYVDMTAPPTCHNHIGEGYTVMTRVSGLKI